MHKLPTAILFALSVIVIGYSLTAIFVFGVGRIRVEETTSPIPFEESDFQIESRVPYGEISQDIQGVASKTPLKSKVPPEIVWGDRNKRQAIFTFDGGSGTQSITKILTALKKHKVKGTFFLTGMWMKKNPSLTKQISLAGHEIFNHTWSHPDLTTLSTSSIVSQLEKTDTLLKQLTGKTTKPYFRPPYGRRNSKVRQVAWEKGYRTVIWTIDALDWKESSGMTAAQVKSRIMAHLKPGTIYLMHIGDNITGNILDSVFTQIKNKGYIIRSLSGSEVVERGLFPVPR